MTRCPFREIGCWKNRVPCSMTQYIPDISYRSFKVVSIFCFPAADTCINYRNACFSENYSGKIQWGFSCCNTCLKIER
jgi:hypothetical protein